MLDKGVERRGPPKRAGFFARMMMGVGRLIVPVGALLATLGLLWVLRGEVARDFHFLAGVDPVLDPNNGKWLTWSLVMLPLVYFVLNLTNRRYGSGFTLLAAVLTMALVAGGIYWALAQGVIHSFEAEVASRDQAIAFGGSLFLGTFLCIYLFEWLRGIPWWEAPFVGALVGGVAQVFAFQALTIGLSSGSLAHAFEGDVWPRLLALSLLQLLWAIAQLLPTEMLRRVIRPLSGYGGA